MLALNDAHGREWMFIIYLEYKFLQAYVYLYC